MSGEQKKRFSWSLVTDGKSNTRLSSSDESLFGKNIRYRDPEEVVPPADKILVAAALIEASFSGTFMSYHLQQGVNSKVKWYKIYHNTSIIRAILLVLLMLLSFFERPLWCFQTNCNIVRDPQNVIQGVTPEMYFSGIPKLGVYFSISFELFFLIFLWFLNVFLCLMISRSVVNLFRPGFVISSFRLWKICFTFSKDG